jgi:hypothetical protein
MSGHTQSCESSSRLFCSCFQDQNPSTKHDDLLHCQLLSIADDINNLADRFQQINIDKFRNGFKVELDRWRQNEYNKIDELYKQKCSDNDRNFNIKFPEQKRVIKDLQNLITAHIRKHDASNEIIDTFHIAIQDAKENLDLWQREEENSNRRIISPSINSLELQSEPRHNIDLSSLPPPYKTIRVRNVLLMLTNGEHIILIQNNKLRFYDKQLKLIKKIPFYGQTPKKIIGERFLYSLGFRSKSNPLLQNSLGEISDVCYCESLKSFIIIANSDVFFLDDKTMKIEKLEDIPSRIAGCTASETMIYLLSCQEGNCILEYTIPDIKYVKRWYLSYGQEYQASIRTIRYHNKRLALINVSYENMFIELRDSVTYDRLWILNTEYDKDSPKIFCSPFQTNQWLLTQFHHNTLVHISANGIVKDYNEGRFQDVIQVIQIDSSVLAFLDQRHLSLYK